MANLVLGATRPGKSTNSSPTVGHDVAIGPGATPSPRTLEVSWCRVAIMSSSQKMSHLVGRHYNSSIATVIFHKCNGVHF